MMHLYAVNSLRFSGIAMLLPVLAGCGIHDRADSTGLSLRRVRAYFETLKIGVPVTQIERDLGLGTPEKQRAPAELDPVWRFRYTRDDLVINFAAEMAGEVHGGRSNFVFSGEWSVKTKAESERELRALLDKGSLAKPKVSIQEDQSKVERKTGDDGSKEK